MLIRHCGCTTQVIAGWGMPGFLKGTMTVGDLLQPIPSVWHNCTFRHAHRVPVRLSPKLKSSFSNAAGSCTRHQNSTRNTIPILLYPRHLTQSWCQISCHICVWKPSCWEAFLIFWHFRELHGARQVQPLLQKGMRQMQAFFWGDLYSPHWRRSKTPFSTSVLLRMFQMFVLLPVS